MLTAVGCISPARPASADAIADWNDKAVTHVLGRNLPPPPAERIMARVHLAMFDAVNSIERNYRPYLGQLPASAGASREAAAAAAASAVIVGTDPLAQAEMKATLAAYLAAISDTAGKATAPGSRSI
jgi:hypothetical protein